MNDLKFALRQLLKNPGFTAVAVLTLALGIGANTAIFSVVNAVLLRPLPYPDSGRLVMITEANPSLGQTRAVVTPASFDFWREHGTVFEGLAALRFVSWNLSAEGIGPERIQVARATPGVFELLGIRPLLGRTFLSHEDRKGLNKVCVLSHSFWTRRFGADPNIIGTSMEANGSRFEIIGVMPAHFKFFHPENIAGWPEKLPEPDLWNPWPADSYQNRWDPTFLVIGRLNASATIGQAQAEIRQLAGQLAERFPDSHARRGAEVMPLQNAVFSRSQPISLVLLGTVGFFLLLTCGNVANLLLARAVGRRREFAVRSALGASRWRLVWQSCTEAILLAVLGGVVGLVIAKWSIDLLPSLGGGTDGYISELRLDARMLGFTITVSLATGLLCGLVASLRVFLTNLRETLSSSGRSTEGFQRDRLRTRLVIAEIAVALMLLTAAGLMIESLGKLLRVDPGFTTGHLVAADVSLLDKKYRSMPQAVAFLRQLEERLAAIPGVESVGTGYGLPFGNMISHSFATILLGDSSPASGQTNFVLGRMVSPGYFRALEIPVMNGRPFQDADTTNAPPVVVVNEAFVRRFFPGGSPIGQRLVLNDGGGNPCEIIGVVGDTRPAGLDVPPSPEIYRSIYEFCPYDFSLVLRTKSDPNQIISMVRREVAELDRDRPLYNIRTMAQEISRSVAPRQFTTVLMSVFGSLAMLVAAIGIYGVISYSVQQQTREIGVRMALGARAWDIIKLVAGQGLRVILPGLLIGIIGACAATRWISAQLFGVAPTDPATFATVSALLLVVGLLACVLPAWRGVRTDPMEALRHE